MYPFPSLTFYDPITAILIGILAFGLLLCLPGFLLACLIDLLSAYSPERPLWSPAARARLVARRRHKHQVRLEQATRTQATTARAHETPWTTAQQARYDDMRAKGWADLASRQAAERLRTPAYGTRCPGP